MFENVADYEVMRNAMDRRLGVWAVVLSMAPRVASRDRAGLRAAASSAIQKLARQGMIYLFRMPRAWGQEEVVDAAEYPSVLAEDKNWRPRKSNPRQLVRLACTPTGAEAFEHGEFGPPPPMLEPEQTAESVLDDLPQAAPGPEIDPRDLFGEYRY